MRSTFLLFLPSSCIWAFAFAPINKRSTSRSRFSAHVHVGESLSRPVSVSSPSHHQRTTIFDFTDNVFNQKKNQSLASFERIDDAIMGGISTSRLGDAPGCDYVRWSGVCRTDGGGFCGMRTRSLEKPLMATGHDGIFIVCRFASDNEPHRRVWKVSLRSDASRGEMMLYQAAFSLPTHTTLSLSSSSSSSSSLKELSWTTVQIPFDEFIMVRGPVAVPNAPPLNISQGIYQIGLIMSKFMIGPSMQEIQNFRSGYFDLHIQKIGFYRNNNTTFVDVDMDMMTPMTRNTMDYPLPQLLNNNNNNNNNSNSKTSLILKPLFQFLFSEKANRRKSAMRILTLQRGLSRFQAILFGIRWRYNQLGMLGSLYTTLNILGSDILRFMFAFVLRLAIFYPTMGIQMIRKRIFPKRTMMNI